MDAACLSGLMVAFGRVGGVAGCAGVQTGCEFNVTVAFV